MDVTSTKNPLVKDIIRLRTKQHRAASGRCYIEGIQPVLRAMENGVRIESIICAPELLTSETAKAALTRLGGTEQQRVLVSANVFRHFSERDNPVGLAAIATPRLAELPDLNLDGQSILTVLYRVHNPGNLGTIVRTIDSVAGAGLILLGPTADPFDPACIKASMGAVFSVPIVALKEPDDFLTWCHRNHVQLVTTSAEATSSLPDARFSYPCAIMLGNEGQGLPPALLSVGDISVSIPMYGQASSLNLAVACGIVLYAARSANPCRKSSTANRTLP